MQIYLVRHTTPAIDSGICYGRTDVALAGTFYDEAARISSCVPAGNAFVYSSPLSRCRLLAQHLFPEVSICYDERLAEIHCGDWEMKAWDSIDQQQLDNWMKNFMTEPYPGGENYLQFQERVMLALNEIMARNHSPSVIITHAGVIRCMLSHLQQTSIHDVLRIPVPYASVVCLKV